MNKPHMQLATYEKYKETGCEDFLYSSAFFFLLTKQQNTDYIHTYNTSEEEYSVHI